MDTSNTLGGYLLGRLHEMGLRHMFGIPGDYVLGLYQMIEDSPIQNIGTTREDCAGFAADAYARIHGIGAFCVTYCVGGLGAVNAVASAYAERSPVVLLSGSPGLNERGRSPFLHHMVKDFATQRDVFEKITVASVILDDPQTAPRLIDMALAALHWHKRPIYLEVPRDLVLAPITRPLSPPPVGEASDPDALAEALAEVSAMLAAARRPVVLAGADVQRFGVQEELVRIVERLNAPVASTLMGKSVIREDHPLYVGIYGGLIGREAVNTFVEAADCVLMLGSVLTDLDLGGPGLPEARVVHAAAGRVAVKRHQYGDVRFEDFMRALAQAPLTPAASRPLPPPEENVFPRPAPGEPATLAGVFGALDDLLDENMVVVADVGEALFAAADLRVQRAGEFLGQAYYTSMGFACPAALGVGCAAPALRPVVLVGDGAFQMTGTELSTCVRQGIAPIVVVLNNEGYSTEREILEGPFNDIANWNYHKICEFVGGGVGTEVRTHGAVVAALKAAIADPAQMHVLNVRLSSSDRSAAMRRLAGRLADKLALTG